MGIKLLIQRLKLRIPSRRKTEPRLLLSWEEIDANALTELLQAAREDALANIEQLNEALRTPN